MGGGKSETRTFGNVPSVKGVFHTHILVFTTAPTAVQRWMVMGMRLIDADELKKRILVERGKIPLTCPGASYEFYISKPYQHGNSMRGGIRKALRCMEQCKTVDAVSVVRCKDCKHWCDSWVAPDGKHTHGECHMEDADDVIVGRWGDDFCSYGERKDNERKTD